MLIQRAAVRLLAESASVQFVARCSGQFLIVMHDGVIEEQSADVAAVFGKERRFAEALGVRFQAVPLDDEDEAGGVFDAALDGKRAAAGVALDDFSAALDACGKCLFFARNGLKCSDLSNHDKPLSCCARCHLFNLENGCNDNLWHILLHLVSTLFKDLVATLLREACPALT